MSQLELIQGMTQTAMHAAVESMQFSLAAMAIGVVNFGLIVFALILLNKILYRQKNHA